MVATIARLNAGNVGYYTKSYYLDGQAEGRWLDTEAARHFGIADAEVKPTQFSRLLEGFDPKSGEPLVQNAGGKSRQVGWDIQFGIHKSFSVLHAILPEVRQSLEASLRDAARDAINEVLEREFMESRIGRAGSGRVKASAAFAGFLHETNRENEKHLHLHCVIPNVGLREDGTTGTLVSWNLFNANHALGKAFHARFTELVRERCRIECEIDERGLSRVRGFPEDIAKAFSTPSRRISELASGQTAKAKEEANLKLRPTKSYLPTEAVNEECREKAERLGFTAEAARAFLGHTQEGLEAKLIGQKAEELLREVITSLPPEFSITEFYERAYEAGARAELPFDAIKEGISEALADESLIQPLGRISKEQYFRRTGVEESVEQSAARGLEHSPTLHDAFMRIVSNIPDISFGELRDETDGSAPSGELSRQDERMLARAIGESIQAALGTLSLASDVNEEAASLLAEAARGGVKSAISEGLSETPFSGSIDTDSVSIEKAAEESRRVSEKLRAVEELLPGMDAKGLLRKVVERSRARFFGDYYETLLSRGVEKLTRSEAHFTQGELIKSISKGYSKTRLDEERLKAAFKKALSMGELVSLGTWKNDKQYSTPEVLRIEKEAIEAAEKLSGRSSPRVNPERVKGVLEGMPELTEAHKEAVERAVRGNSLFLIEDESGLKLHAIQKALGMVLWPHHAIFVAPTNTAAQELSRVAVSENASTLKKLIYKAAQQLFELRDTENVTTLQKLIFALDRTAKDSLLHHGKMVINAALGQPTYQPTQFQLSPQSTIVVDSASLSDTRNFSRLLTHAEKAHARVIVCGTHRMPALGLGGLFKELIERADPQQVAKLTEGEGHRLSIHGSSDPMNQLIESWSENALKKPSNHLIVAASNDHVRHLNQMAQAERKKAGLLGLRSMVIRYKSGGELFKERIYEGDRVAFTGRSQKEVINGVYGTVKHIDLITGRIKVKLDQEEKRLFPWEFRRNKTITFRYREYRFFRRRIEGFRLGYADNIYRTQNLAVKGNSYVLGDGPGGAPSAVYARLGLANGTTYLFSDEADSRGVLERARVLEEKTSAHTVMREIEARKKALELLEQTQRADQLRMRGNQGQSMRL